jgi:hypothetical protein
MIIRSTQGFHGARMIPDLGGLGGLTGLSRPALGRRLLPTNWPVSQIASWDLLPGRQGPATKPTLASHGTPSASGGPAVQSVQSAWRHPGELLAAILADGQPQPTVLNIALDAKLSAVFLRGQHLLWQFATAPSCLQRNKRMVNV